MQAPESAPYKWAAGGCVWNGTGHQFDWLQVADEAQTHTGSILTGEGDDGILLVLAAIPRRALKKIVKLLY